jgi:undecaprenyl-diphosphatase
MVGLPRWLTDLLTVAADWSDQRFGWRRRFAPHVAWVGKRLSPGSHVGLRLTCGVLIMLGAAWLFGGIAQDVIAGDPLTLVDVLVAHWLHQHATPSMTTFLLAVTQAHEWLPVLTATALLCAFFAWRRQRDWLVVTLWTVPGGMLLNWLLKLVFRRPRPTVSDYVHALQSYGFPSGHTMAATLFYGLVASYAVARAQTWRRRIFVPCVAVGCVWLVAFSRLYLGAHYLSDVLAAMAEGVFWLALCMTTIHVRSAGQPQPPPIGDEVS